MRKKLSNLNFFLMFMGYISQRRDQNSCFIGLYGEVKVRWNSNLKLQYSIQYFKKYQCNFLLIMMCLQKYLLSPNCEI